MKPDYGVNAECYVSYVSINSLDERKTGHHFVNEISQITVHIMATS